MPMRAPPVSFLPRVTVLVISAPFRSTVTTTTSPGRFFAERGEQCLPVRKRGVVKLLDGVARLDAGRRGCAVGRRHVDRQRRLRNAVQREHQHEHQDGREQVDHDPRRQHEDALGGRESAVGGRARLVQQRHGILGERRGERGEVLVLPVRSGLDGVPVDQDHQRRLGGGQIDIQMLGNAHKGRRTLLGDERERGAQKRVLGAGLHARDAHVAAQAGWRSLRRPSSCRGNESPVPAGRS